MLEKVCMPLTVSTAGRVPPQRFPEIAALLRLIRDYVAASSDPGVAALLLQEGGSSLQQIQVRDSNQGLAFHILRHLPACCAVRPLCSSSCNHHVLGCKVVEIATCPSFLCGQPHLLYLGSTPWLLFHTVRRLSLRIGLFLPGWKASVINILNYCGRRCICRTVH